MASYSALDEEDARLSPLATTPHSPPPRSQPEYFPFHKLFLTPESLFVVVFDFNV